jgi:hypothetical protein
MRFMGIVLVMLFAGTAAAAPEVHVSLPTVGMDDAERACHVDAIRKAMTEAVRETGVDAKTVDLAVSKLSIVIGEDKVQVSAELSVIISTAKDELRSFGSGTATFSIAKRAYRPERTAKLRHQVLSDALDGLQRRMRAAYRPAA